MSAWICKRGRELHKVSTLSPKMLNRLKKLLKVADRSPLELVGAGIGDGNGGIGACCSSCSGHG